MRSTNATSVLCSTPKFQRMTRQRFYLTLHSLQVSELQRSLSWINAEQQDPVDPDEVTGFPFLSLEADTMRSVTLSMCWMASRCARSLLFIWIEGGLLIKFESDWLQLSSLNLLYKCWVHPIVRQTLPRCTATFVGVR